MQALIQQLAMSQLAQTKAITEAMSRRHDNKENQHSVLSVKPNIRWPTIDDSTEGLEIVDTFELFESNCQLANDSKGMLPVERLTSLKNILKIGSANEKIYRNVERAAKASSTWYEDPDSVYLRIKAKMMRFVETLIEKKERLHRDKPK